MRCWELKEIILEKLCYTELVYERINKKLGLNLLKSDIENLVYQTIKDHYSEVCKQGKNYYIKNNQTHIQITVNSNNYRVITADKI